MSQALADLLEQLRGDSTLDRPERLRERADALDRLERLAWYLPEPADATQTASLRAQVAAQQARLEAADRDLYAHLRASIRRGDGARALRAWMPATHADDASGARGEGYDHLDQLLSGVLQLPEPDGEIAALAPELVFYQPTPTRHIFDLIARVRPGADDVLIDLGSGLGHVPLLVGACTSARCIGVELEPAYLAGARASAEALGLSRVDFVHADARVADLSAATVFYLYTPFNGAVLDRVLERIRIEAGQRELRVCGLGPCSERLAALPWLRLLDADWSRDRVAVFAAYEGER